MSESDVEILRFLQGVQAARANMHHVWRHYTRRHLKVEWGQNAFGPSWTDRALEFGIMVTGSDGENYELSARLLFPGDAWVVESEAGVERETEKGWAYPILRERPARTFGDWEQAVAELAKAIAELTAYDDLIPAPSQEGGRPG